VSECDRAVSHSRLLHSSSSCRVCRKFQMACHRYHAPGMTLGRNAEGGTGIQPR
jgi:hypothetical protein